MRNLHPLLFFVVGFLVSCGTMGYRYYGLDLEQGCYSKGTLLADDGSQSAFTMCQPDDHKKFKCVIQSDEDYFAKEKNAQKCVIDLIACQKSCKP